MLSGIFEITPYYTKTGATILTSFVKTKVSPFQGPIIIPVQGKHCRILSSREK